MLLVAPAHQGLRLQQLCQGQSVAVAPDFDKDRCWQYYYDTDQRKIGSVDPAGFVTSLTYGTADRQLQECRFATSVQTDRSLSTPWDKAPPPASGDDAVSYYFYDLRSRQTVTVDPQGFVTQVSFTANSLQRLHEQFVNPVSDQWYNNTTLLPQVPHSSEDQSTLFCYDPLNRLVNTNSTRAIATKNDYDIMGNLIFSDTSDLLQKQVHNNEQHRHNLMAGIKKPLMATLLSHC